MTTTTSQVQPFEAFLEERDLVAIPVSKRRGVPRFELCRYEWIGGDFTKAMPQIPDNPKLTEAEIREYLRQEEVLEDFCFEFGELTPDQRVIPPISFLSEQGMPSARLYIQLGCLETEVVHRLASGDHLVLRAFVLKGAKEPYPLQELLDAHDMVVLPIADGSEVQEYELRYISIEKNKGVGPPVMDGNPHLTEVDIRAYFRQYRILNNSCGLFGEWPAHARTPPAENFLAQQGMPSAIIGVEGTNLEAVVVHRLPSGDYTARRTYALPPE